MLHTGDIAPAGPEVSLLTLLVRPLGAAGSAPPAQANAFSDSKEHDMSNYVLVYTGGSMPETEQAQAAAMAAWGAWFGALGSAVVDAGNPFGPAASITSDGAVTDGGPSGLTGYSILKADSLGAATTLAKDCPVLSTGGAIEVYETFEVM
jgi:hypothetical protein